MKIFAKSSKSMFFVFCGLVILAIMVAGEARQAEGGTGLLSGLKELFIGTDETNGAVFEQDFSQSMSAKAETHLVISHSHGNIVIKGWDKDEMKLEGKKIVSARDEETAQIYAEQMKVEMKSKDGKIVVKTIRPKREKAWEIRKMAINYKLYAPKSLNVVLESMHGNVHTESFAGDFKLKGLHGNFHMAQIGGDISIEHEHGNIEVLQIGGDASVRKEHGNAKIDSVGGGLEMKHEHGNVNLAKIGEGANLVKRHGDLSVAEVVGMLKLDHEHGNLSLRLIEGDVEVEKQHGNVDVESVNGNLSIHSDHTRLRIVDIDGDVRLRGSHGDVYIEDVSGVADIQRSHSKVHSNSVEGILQ